MFKKIFTGNARVHENKEFLFRFKEIIDEIATRVDFCNGWNNSEVIVSVSGGGTTKNSRRRWTGTR